MTWATIVKSPDAGPGAPRPLDYARGRAPFAWAPARAEVGGLPGGRGLNIAHEAVDRHAAGARRDRLALRWLGKNGEVEDFTYARLRGLTNRLPHLPRGLRGSRPRAGGPDPGAVRRGARHAEEPERLLPPLRGLGAGAAPRTPRDR